MKKLTDAQEARKRAFRKWMDANGLNYESMGKRIGISYGTVMHWGIYGRKPRSLALAAIKRKYPDCPLLSDIFGTDKEGS